MHHDNISTFAYFWVQSYIGPASTDSPPPKAPIPSLSYLRVVGACVTATRERAMLVSVITGVAVGDTTARITHW